MATAKKKYWTVAQTAWVYPWGATAGACGDGLTRPVNILHSVWNNEAAAKKVSKRLNRIEEQNVAPGQVDSYPFFEAKELDIQWFTTCNEHLSDSEFRRELIVEGTKLAQEFLNSCRS